MNQNKNIPALPQEEESSIDIKYYFFKFFKNWYFFVGSLFITLFVAYAINKYSESIYKGKITLLIKDDERWNLGNQNFLESLDMFKTKKNFLNELKILGSLTLTERTLSKLDFLITYNKKGKFRYKENYGGNPFTVIIDSSHYQLLDYPIYIKLISRDVYEVRLKESDKLSVINIKEGNVLTDFSINKEITKTLNYGETFEGDNYKFKVFLNENFKSADDFKEEYSFSVNNPENQIRAYSGATEIKPVDNKGSTVVEVIMNNSSGLKIINFLTMLAQEYLNIDLDEKNLRADNTINFINDQLAEITDSLYVDENRLQNFRIEHGIMDISMQTSYIINKYQELDEDKALENLKLKYFKYLLDYLEKNQDLNDIMAPSTMDIQDQGLNNLVGQLRELSKERQLLQFSSTSKNPYFATLESQIESTKSALIENVKNIVEVSKLKISEINTRYIEIEEQLSKLPRTEKEYLGLKRKFTVSDEMYNFLLLKRSESGIAKASIIPDNKILDKAILEKGGLPISPKRKMNYIIALVLGLLIPAIIILIIDFFNDKITDKKDIEMRSNIPILGMVIHSNLGINNVVAEKPKSVVSETFRAVRINLQFFLREPGSKVITVTSTVSGEGKTFCSMNLATTFALADKKVVLIGCDLRKPRIFSDFNLTNDKGISTFLIGKASLEDVTNKTSVKNLDIITAGPVPPNPSELLESHEMTQLIEKLRTLYDIIIIDTPPVGFVADAFTIVKNVDAYVFVVRQKVTAKKAIDNLNDIVNNIDIPNLSILVNGVKFEYTRYGYSSYGYGYGYGYGSGYGYGYHEDDDIDVPNQKKKKKKKLGMFMF